MKLRILAALAMAVAAMTICPSAAQAAVGPPQLQRLAAAQTQLLFRYYQGPPQAASPATCNLDRGGGHKTNEKDRDRGTVRAGVLLLPSLSFGSGDQTFWCNTKANAVLVDLQGAVATEDRRGDTYQLADGTDVTFARANLSRICDDVLRFFPQSAPATVDERPIVGTPVSTGTFRVKVNPGTPASPNAPYYQDSIDLGHPGTLTACYAGQKAIVQLTPGYHVIRVQLVGADQAPSHFVYHVHVQEDHD